MSESSPVQIDNRIGVRVEWYCTPPLTGQIHCVTREEWPDIKVTGLAVRRIYAWVPAEPIADTV